MSKVNICIIPAAGRGSRWAPVSGYLPKEMLPLVDRPVIEWVIEEAINAGCKEIVVVINKQKQLIKDYLQQCKYITSKANLVFINQDQPRGISHALLLCQKLIKDEPFTVALPDLPTISRKSVLSQLIQVFNKQEGKAHIISFNAFPPETLHHYTECLLEFRPDQLLEISHFCPKNPGNKPHHPGNKLRMSGRYVLKSEILPLIENLLTLNPDTEVKEFDALVEAIKNGQKVLGVDIEGHTYDTGNPTSYIRANSAFFKKKLAKKH